MLDKEVLEILKELTEDIPDFMYISTTIQNQIAFWILEDRKHKPDVKN